MNRKWLAVGVACLGVVSLMAGPAFSGDEHEMSEEQQAMMKAWMEVSTPGEHHLHLEPLVGSWDYTLKWRMGAEAPWDEGKGKTTNSWILGRRFVQQAVDGEPMAEMGGLPFEGVGTLGYDKGIDKYTSTWMDNMGTGTMISYGTCDESGKTINWQSEEFYCCMKQGMKTARSVTKIINNDKHVFQMYDKGPDGKEFMAMEITYTRK